MTVVLDLAMRCVSLLGVTILLFAVCVQGLDVWRVGATHTNAELRVAIVCGWHAREWATVELCKHWESLVHHDTRMRWIIVPEMNMQTQRVKQQQQSSCLRVNQRGVDPNRNWPEQCDNGEPASKPGEEFYGGTLALSEPEVRELDQLLREEQPHLLLLAHTGSNMILTPYDSACMQHHENRTSVEHLSKLANWLADALPSNSQWLRPLVGPGHELLFWYKVSGGLTDYAMQQLGVPLVLTLETYKDHQQCLDSTVELGCAHQFVPHDPQTCRVDLQPYLQRWGAIVRTLRDMPEDDLTTLRSWVL